MPITELPPFTPRLEGYHAEEFLRHSLLLLEYPIEQDQTQLDLEPFQVKPPPPPPDPAVPLLPHVWYPKPLHEIVQLAPQLVQAPRPMLFMGQKEPLERVLRPLLSGEGPIMVQGETGMGVSTFLHHIAHHERTRQRFRKIWYINDPERLGQLGGILLGLSNVLAQAEPYHQLALLANELDDDTLVIIDNLTTDHPLYLACQTLSPFILLGIEIPPEEFETDEQGRTIIPPDPPNTITLRRWSEDEAVQLLAHLGELEDRKGIPREIRPLLAEMAALVDFQPLGLMILGSMLSEDDLPLEQFLGHLRKLAASTQIPLGTNLAIQICMDSLPTEYRRLVEAFAPFSILGTSADALQYLSDSKQELAFWRGITILKRRNLIFSDERLAEHFSVPKRLYRQLNVDNPHEPGKTNGERARAWITRFVDEAVYEPAQLFLGEHHIRHAYYLIQQHKMLDLAAKLNRALSDYTRTYMPRWLSHDAPPPRLMGERAEAMKQARQGLEQAEQGDIENGRSTLNSALTMLQEHGSNHDLAEALVMLGRLELQAKEAIKSSQLLEKAAQLVFDLNAQESVSVVRLGLAMAYRAQGRYKDALGVLDERPEADAERARIYRAQGKIEDMLRVLTSGDMTPYARAESYLQAQHYADALESIAHDNTPSSSYLRALIYHLQGDYDTAQRGYQRALQNYAPNDPLRAIPARAIATIHTLQQNYSEGEALLNVTLDELRNLGDVIQIGLTQALLAAIHLQQGNNRTAAETANQALQKLKGSTLHRDMGAAYRTLARANWRLERYEDALRAFLAELEHVQSDPQRDENRIGLAFYHTAEAYRQIGQMDRAIANHRLTLNHLKADVVPYAYLMGQSALYRALVEANRLPESLEMNFTILQHLDRYPPPDLQYLGYWLCRLVRAHEQNNNLKEAYIPLMRWLNTLVGRADALTDQSRPMLAVLALALATRSLMALDRMNDAQAIAAEALQLADEHLTRFDWLSVRWAVRRDYGEILIQLGIWEQANQVLTPLLRDEVKQDIFTYTSVYEGVAIALYELGKPREALEHYWVALESQPIPHKQGLILERIAHSYLALGEIPNAVENFNEALKFVDRQQFPHISARILTDLAHTLAGVNRYADAIGIYEEALRILNALPDISPLHTARVYDSLGRSNERQGQLHDATQAYRRALDLIEQNQISAPDDYRSILLRLARVMVIRQDYDTAIPYFEKARDEALNWGTHLEVGNISRELAEAERDGGRLAASLKTYEDGLVFLTPEYPSERAALLRSHGQALVQTQQYEEARRAWNEALELTQDLSPLEIALTHHAIGQAFRAQDDYTGAAQAFREALEHHPKGTVQLAATYRELGEVLFASTLFDEALSALQSSLEIEKALPQQSNARLVKVLQMVALTEERREQIQSAITQYHAALVYMDRQFQPLLYAETLRTLGRLYAELKKWDEAHKAWAEALELEQSIKPRSDERMADLLRMVGNAYMEEGHLEKAANAFKRMATYANLTQEETSKLRTALSDLERYKETLNTALDSLMVLEKTGGELKDFVFVYALIVRMYFLLSEMDASRNMMARLVKFLQNHADELDMEDERPEYRTLAHFRQALVYDNQGENAHARDHYRQALKDCNNTAMIWLIEQSMGDS